MCFPTFPHQLGAGGGGRKPCVHFGSKFEINTFLSAEKCITFDCCCGNTNNWKSGFMFTEVAPTPHKVSRLVMRDLVISYIMVSHFRSETCLRCSNPYLRRFIRSLSYGTKHGGLFFKFSFIEVDLSLYGTKVPAFDSSLALLAVFFLTSSWSYFGE